VHLVVNATVAHEDLEGSLVTPGVVPGVHAEPVVLSVLGTPTNDLNGVTTKGGSSLVRVDTGLVGEEILIDGEGTGNGTILGDIGLDLVNGTEDTESVR